MKGAQNFYAILNEPRKLLIIPNSWKHETIIGTTDNVNKAITN